MTSVSYRDFTGTAAENYERYFVPTIATSVSASLLRTADLRHGERVLDVACGTGLIARRAAELVGPTGSVTGVDVAPDMIAVARTAGASSTPPIDWHVGDATSLPFPDGSYDVVLCQMGLMLIKDRAAAVAEMRRVLVPGGRVAINTPGTIQAPLEIMERGIVDHISPELGRFVGAVFSMHDPDAVGSLLRDAGLDDVTSTVTTAVLRLPPPAEFLWQYISLTPIGAIVAKAPEAAQAALEREYVEQCQPYVVDGSLIVNQPMVIATGTRQLGAGEPAPS